MVKRLLLASAIMLSAYAQAQTVATFENLSLPNNDTLYVDFATSGYTFSSGLATWHGSMVDYMGYTLTEGFSYSNILDTSLCTTCYDLPYQYAGKEGRGYNSSDKYAVAYAYTPAILTLNGAAAGQPVAGFMLSNTSWGYSYANANYTSTNNGWAKLTVKGYLNGTASTDSVIYYLADFRSSTPADKKGVLNEWTWLDLQVLGNVDSLSFRVNSSDDYFPSYFVMDNLVTMESGYACPDTFSATVTNITTAGASINWTYPNDTTFAGNDSFQVVINQSATVAQTDVINTVINQQTYTAGSLAPQTAYYAHIRSYCHYGQDFTSWETVPFTTAPNSLNDINALPVKLYPNPTSGILHATYDTPLQMWVMDVNGQIVLHQRAGNAIDTKSLAAGQYFIRLTAANGKSVVLPFVKR